MSKSTAAASAIEISNRGEILMLAFELSEEEWLLGFSKGFGEQPIRRKVAARDRRAVLGGIAWAKQKLGLSSETRVVSCYEAGRAGFWLHRFLEASGVENLVVDSASIEVNRKGRAKSDRIDLAALLDLLARYLAGSTQSVWSVVHVPCDEDEDRRHLHRELKLAKKDRTRVGHRMRGLLANQGLTLNLRQKLTLQLDTLRRWDGSVLPRGLRERLVRYAADYEALSERIAELEAERRRRLREERDPVHEQTLQLYSLRGVGMNTAWCYATELFGWRKFTNGKQVGSFTGLTPTPYDSGKSEREQGIGKDGSRWIRGGRDRVRLGLVALPARE